MRKKQKNEIVITSKEEKIKDGKVTYKIISDNEMKISKSNKVNNGLVKKINKHFKIDKRNGKISNIKTNEIRLGSEMRKSCNKVLEKYESSIDFENSNELLITFTYNYDISFEMLEKDINHFLYSSINEFVINKVDNTKEYSKGILESLLQESEIHIAYFFDKTNNDILHCHLFMNINKDNYNDYLDYSKIDNYFKQLLKSRKRNSKDGNVHIKKVESKEHHDNIEDYLRDKYEDGRFPKDVKIVGTLNCKDKPIILHSFAQNKDELADTSNATLKQNYKLEKHCGKNVIKVEFEDYKDVKINEDGLNKMLAIQKSINDENEYLKNKKFNELIEKYKKNIDNIELTKLFDLTMLKKLLSKEKDSKKKPINLIIFIKPSTKEKIAYCNVYLGSKSYSNEKKYRKILSQNFMYWDTLQYLLQNYDVSNKNIWLISIGAKGIIRAKTNQGKYKDIIKQIYKEQEEKNNTIYSIAYINRK